MNKPYRTMITLFALLGALAALDAALAAGGVTPFLLGLRWLRVHLVTLGIFTEAAFGLLPGLVALRAGRPAPPHRRGRWLLLNVGLVTLLVGIPLVRPPMIGAGGTLVLLAAAWLGRDLWLSAPARPERPGAAAAGAGGRRYYLAALGFVVVGALVGTGLWTGWGAPLRIATPKETHVHAVIWGYASLVMAGLLTDLPLSPAGEAAVRRPWLTLSFRLQLAGAAALLVAPWVGGANWVMIGGIVLFAAATVILYVQRILPRRAEGGPGAAHLLTAYLWILVPATALPFIVLSAGALPIGRVESVGPAILAYGWLLQALIALLPPAFAMVGRAESAAAGGTADGPSTGSPALGGRWWSWAGLNLCALSLVASIALPPFEARLQGLGFGILAVVLLAWAWEWERIES